MKEYKYKINGTKFNVAVGDVIDNEVTVEVNGVPYKVELEKAVKNTRAIKSPISTASPTAPKAAPVSAPKAAPAPAATAGGAAVKSPLPGTIMSISVKVGDTVTAGQTVCVLEAMKMENDVHTTAGGTVKQILVSVGDAILEGADIMIIG